MLEFPGSDDSQESHARSDIVHDSDPSSGGLAEAVESALADCREAKARGADLVEFRIDAVFEGSFGDDAADAHAAAQFHRLLDESTLPVVLTCRPSWEGGEYEGDDESRAELLEKLCCGLGCAPAYIDVELAAYTKSAEFRDRIDSCVSKANGQGSETRLILSIHDFKGRPADLDRMMLKAYDEPACSIVKVAYRARSLRDNLDLFEMTRNAPKPTIALGMGEFGLMSRVLAPKFNGFLTFASLRNEAATAPGQPTIDELLEMYRFRSIGKATKFYGVIGWPVGQSLSPLIHNAGFAEIGWDGVYLPLPIAADAGDAEASYTSFKATVESMLADSVLGLGGVSVTIPHKLNAAKLVWENGWFGSVQPWPPEALNTLVFSTESPTQNTSYNTDVDAIDDLIHEANSAAEWYVPAATVVVHGTGGVARAAVAGAWPGKTRVVGRDRTKAVQLVESLLTSIPDASEPDGEWLEVADDILEDFGKRVIYINCTPVGMTGGPDPDGLSIPIPDMANIGPETVFFDTVYNPVETPMLKAARERGCKTIDGVEMFVKQAAAQFELWTGTPAPVELFDRLCREKLSAD